jgi:hypothetical protein
VGQVGDALAEAPPAAADGEVVGTVPGACGAGGNAIAAAKAVFLLAAGVAFGRAVVALALAECFADADGLALGDADGDALPESLGAAVVADIDTVTLDAASLDPPGELGLTAHQKNPPIAPTATTLPATAPPREIRIRITLRPVAVTPDRLRCFKYGGELYQCRLQDGSGTPEPDTRTGSTAGTSGADGEPPPGRARARRTRPGGPRYMRVLMLLGMPG